MPEVPVDGDFRLEASFKAFFMIRNAASAFFFSRPCFLNSAMSWARVMGRR